MQDHIYMALIADRRGHLGLLSFLHPYNVFVEQSRTARGEFYSSGAYNQRSWNPVLSFSVLRRRRSGWARSSGWPMCSSSSREGKRRGRVAWSVVYSRGKLGSVQYYTNGGLYPQWNLYLVTAASSPGISILVSKIWTTTHSEGHSEANASIYKYPRLVHLYRA